MSRTQFAVAVGLVSLLSCAALPASSRATDRADADAARREGTVSWYTSTPVALAQQLADRFQQQTGIKVQLLRTGGQAVLRRLQQELSAGRPGADVMTMSDAGAANALAKQGLFEPFRPEGFDKIVAAARDPMAAGSPSGFRSSASRSAPTRSRTSPARGRTSSSRNIKVSW